MESFRNLIKFAFEKVSLRPKNKIVDFQKSSFFGIVENELHLSRRSEFAHLSLGKCWRNK